jgi:hypothetical protein
MTTTKDNNGKPIGFFETVTSNDQVITVNATDYATTIVTRDRETGKVKTQTFYGKNPMVTRG